MNVAAGVADGGQRVSEHVRAGSPVRGWLGVEIGGIDRQRLAPRVYDVEVELSGLRFLHGPSQRVLAADGAVDTDD